MSNGIGTIITKSPPSRGAWIEIYLLYINWDTLGVAPLAGGVD